MYVYIYIYMYICIYIYIYIKWIILGVNTISSRYSVQEFIDLRSIFRKQSSLQMAGDVLNLGVPMGTRKSGFSSVNMCQPSVLGYPPHFWKPSYTCRRLQGAAQDCDETNIDLLAGNICHILQPEMS